MTPKEKAGELVDKFWKSCYDKHDIAKLVKADAKQCALIAVDEIIDSEPQYEWSNDYWKNPNDFWKEVKQEIENL
tara:strand:- start:633 stop:857 length:225 start_codon:yes stop_codon:yes gene_type:complete